MDVINVVSALILACLTYVLAKYTKYLHLEAKKTRELQEAPDVTAVLEPWWAFHFCFAIYSQGKADAYNIRIKIIPNIKLGKDKYINDIKFMNLDFLRVGTHVSGYAGSYMKLLEQSKGESLLVDIKYENQYKKTFNKQIYINFSQYKNVFQPDDTIKKISTSLDEISKNFRKAQNHDGKLLVLSQNKKEHDELEKLKLRNWELENDLRRLKDGSK